MQKYAVSQAVITELTPFLGATYSSQICQQSLKAT